MADSLLGQMTGCVLQTISPVTLTLSPFNVNGWEVILEDNTNTIYKAIGTTSLTLTLDSTQDNTWNYIWLIYNGTTIELLSSTSSTTPTLPTGYTYQANIGAVYNNNGNWLPFIQYNKDVFISGLPVFLSSQQGVKLFTPQTISVPVTAKKCGGIFGSQYNLNAYGAIMLAIAGDVNGTGVQTASACMFEVTGVSGYLGYYLPQNFSNLPILIPQTIYWGSNYTGPGGIWNIHITNWSY